MGVLLALLQLLLMYTLAVACGEAVTRGAPALQHLLCPPANVDGPGARGLGGGGPEMRRPGAGPSAVRVPALLGYLLAGAALGATGLADGFPADWSSALRKCALAVILARAGLGLDLEKLRQGKSSMTLRLACVPCVIEATAAACGARPILGLSWGFCFALGFVLAAVSPAVVVPSLLELQDLGFGTAKAIPSMVLAAASLDDVLAICAFGVAASAAFGAEGVDREAGGTLMQWLSAPIQLFGGLAVGVGLGWALGAAPWERLVPAHCACSPAGGLTGGLTAGLTAEGLVMGLRFASLVAAALMAVFVSAALGLGGGGYLATMTLGCVAARGWGAQATKAVSGLTARLWAGSLCCPADSPPDHETDSAAATTSGKAERGRPAFKLKIKSYCRPGLQPLLFSLIGASVDLGVLSGGDLMRSLAVLAIGLSARLAATYSVKKQHTNAASKL